MKRFFALLLIVASIAPVTAQNKKVVTKERAIKTTSVTPVKNNRPTNDIVVSGERSQNNAYKNLSAQKSMLSQQIDALDAKRADASRGVAKKIGQQMEELTKQLGVVERLLATFPTHNNYSQQEFERDDKTFRGHLDSVATLRIAATNPYAGRISNDPELERMYRNYLAQNHNIPLTSIDNDGQVEVQTSDTEPIQYGGDKVFRVMIAISRNAMKPNEFFGIKDIVEQRMPAGGYVYYQGAYSSKSDADRACLSILAGRKFRDAFVVAMVGNRRVSL